MTETMTATALNRTHRLRRPIRSGALTALAVAVLCSLIVAAPAVAAPSFGISLTHSPGNINRGDEVVSYQVKVTNTASVELGEVLTCQANTWQPATEGLKPTFSYQWLRDGVAIGGATAEKYTVVSADQRHSIQCAVTGSNTVNGGTASASTGIPVVPSPAPSIMPPRPASATARPTITPTTPTNAPVGTELSCVAPTNWSGSPTFTFQWLRNGAPIEGAGASTYTVGVADEGTSLQCQATGATGDGGVSSGGRTVGISNNRYVVGGATTLSSANTPVSTSGPGIIGGAWTSGPVTAFLSLPPGLKLSTASGSAETASGTGWTCDSPTQSCTSSTVVGPGAEFPVLNFSRVWIDSSAPAVIVSSASVNGGGATKGATAKDTFALGPETPFGLIAFVAKAEDEAGADYTQAGGHPWRAVADFAVSSRVGARGNPVPTESLRDGIAELPAGFIGNPTSAEDSCTAAALINHACPEAAAVGEVDVLLGAGIANTAIYQSGVFRMVPERGYPAEFGFTVSSISFIVRTNVRSDGDYGITSIAPLVPGAPAVYRSKFTFCGYGVNIETNFFGSVPKGCKTLAEATTIPFLTNPTNCSGGAPSTRFSVDSWTNPGRKHPNGLPDFSDPNWKTLTVQSPPIDGCEALTQAWTSTRKPSFTMQPDTREADSPAAYTVRLHVPQDGLDERTGLATSHLKDTTVVLPRGVALNPSAADGVEGCAEGEIGLTSKDPIRFNLDQPSCPDQSKLGNVKVETPLLENPLKGSIYLAAPHSNPFGSLFAIYLAVEEPRSGVVVKLAGKIVTDPVTGQVTTRFTDGPQLPFTNLDLDFYGGPRSPLANPATCGNLATQSSMSPWSALDPDNPAADEVAVTDDPLTIDSGPGGSACASSPAQQPFNLGFSAGSQDTTAGASKPFSFRVTRPDGAQAIDSVSLAPPAGFTASLKGIPYCSEAQIAAAAKSSGKAEQANPACPANSRVGTTMTGAGAGSSPYYSPGGLYLAGPYKGAPLSVVAITPAVAGPFDLGDVVVRAALYVNPVTAQITAKTDPIPQILEGVPLRIRDIRINLDRPNWAINPSSCEPMSVTGQAVGVSGATANLSSRFQVSNCGDLGFKPRLRAHLTGGTHRNDHPSLTATLTARPGDANIGRVAVTLPHSEFLDQAHIRTVCTRVQFAAKECPAGSIYGKAEAITPLLDEPLAGPVYLRSSDNKLPDLVVALKGPDRQPIEIDLAGRIDSINGGIRNSFELVPDAPVSKFVLSMKGGKRGLLVNSRNICAKPAYVTARIVGQNGKRADQYPRLTNGCKKAKRVKGNAKHRGKG